MLVLDVLDSKGSKNYNSFMQNDLMANETPWKGISMPIKGKYQKNSGKIIYDLKIIFQT